MSDEPKISKHHAGQHPALKSFRAFDIIPPSKVKPGHTARPIITSQPKHFDNTLMPSGSELPLQITTDPEPVAAKTTPTDETVTQAQDSSEISETSSAFVSDAAEPSESKVASDTPELPEPTASEQAIDQGDLASILGQTNKPDSKTDTAPLDHSPEFANALQEFAAQPQEPEATKPVVAVHRRDYMRMALLFLLWFVVCVVLAAIVIDLLLDTKTLQTTYSIPHTHFFQD